MSDTQAEARAKVIDKSSRVKDLEYCCIDTHCGECPEKPTCAVKTGNFELFKKMMVDPSYYK